MAGIRLPDIGRLGIRIATGIKDRKRVAPNNMVEHARLKALSQRLDNEKKERRRALVKEQRQIRKNKRKIESRRLQLSNARKEVGGRPFHENLITSYPALTHSQASAVKHRRVKFTDLSLVGHASQRNVRPEEPGRDCMVNSGMIMTTIELKQSAHPIISSSLISESDDTKLHFRLPSIIGQRQHKGTKPAKRKTMRPRERDLHSDVKWHLEAQNLKVLSSTNYDKPRKEMDEKIFQTESTTKEIDCIVGQEFSSSNHDVADRNENEFSRITEHGESTEEKLDRAELRRTSHQNLAEAFLKIKACRYIRTPTTRKSPLLN